MDKAKLYVSMGLIVFGITASFAALNYPEGSRTLPMFYSAVLVLLSGALLIQSTRRNPQEAGPESSEPFGKVLEVVAFIGGYIFLIPRLGFYSSTACFLLSFMLMTRAARFFKALVISGATTLAVYAFFELLLRVPAPQGLWI